ncbi:hypothetical protein F3I27_12980 [Pantoea sp. Bo_2]|uniref:hypothetical protein n=1 Tax=unclassified Pantoea TaxID=2630326 RepID=UPI001232A0BF|nr:MULTISPECIES: hypothetical protein [unclassified Pantoea]KAA5939589.1 hypothetical protein F3I57_18685 [Pantoea sp. VH_3]KAA5948556.1 hypothetical protein F3I56_19275 [Pantoea sp. VH_25]KAA5955489.1 hypothetical protein F3I55_13020 [Pantoea sp. VH_24]KAA5958890.1 hypothetical protein F3I53_13230 [Pantoea sp. VH_16]KAA5964088.1 hypothetical protein F3I54_13070 [Pantoea sp. VH_18]
MEAAIPSGYRCFFFGPAHRKLARYLLTTWCCDYLPMTSVAAKSGLLYAKNPENPVILLPAAFFNYFAKVFLQAADSHNANA